MRPLVDVELRRHFDDRALKALQASTQQQPRGNDRFRRGAATSMLLTMAVSALACAPVPSARRRRGGWPGLKL
jgi:hypothetical protein